MNAPVALVRFLKDGELELFAFANDGMELRFLVVDERCPDDRVFEITERLPLAVLAVLVPVGTEVGHRNDERNDALLGVFDAASEGRRHLSVVPSEQSS